MLLSKETRKYWFFGEYKQKLEVLINELITRYYICQKLYILYYPKLIHLMVNVKYSILILNVTSDFEDKIIASIQPKSQKDIKFVISLIKYHIKLSEITIKN